MTIKSKKSILIYGALGLIFFISGSLLCLTLVGMIIGFPMIGIGLIFFTMADKTMKNEAKK